MAEMNQERGLQQNSGQNAFTPPLMASRRSFHNYIYPSSEFPYSATSSNDIHEFDEAEIWSSYGVAATGSKNKSMAVYGETKKVVENKMIKRATTPASSKPAASSSSVPLSVPDWSKILQVNDGKRYAGFEEEEEEEEEDDEEEENDKVPPHEYLARRRGASFSVHEGMGRTLKGRDLSRVRNAVWKRTGFED